MSSILKALKKLEEQKAPRPQYELDLSSGIMRERKAGRHRRWVIPAGMAAVAIAAALTTYAVLTLHQTGIGGNQPEVASTIIVPPLPPQPATALSPPAGIPAAAPSMKADTARPAVAGGAASATAVDGRPAPRPAPRQQKSETPPRPEHSAAIAEIPTAPAAASPPPPERSDNTSIQIPHLRLSGIAWQKDSASRYAVVNGIAVSQGSTIEGAKIEEILPDKVRFSVGSRFFEVPMGHISPTN